MQRSLCAGSGMEVCGNRLWRRSVCPEDPGTEIGTGSFGRERRWQVFDAAYFGLFDARRGRRTWRRR